MRLKKINRDYKRQATKMEKDRWKKKIKTDAECENKWKKTWEKKRKRWKMMKLDIIYRGKYKLDAKM